jgi:ubiquinone/menaquinone biosynthesis C-methylase UbiE
MPELFERTWWQIGVNTVLTHSQAKDFYNRFGIKQDKQAFYEDAAIDDLLKHSAFEQAQSVFEFGCGTGRLALNLLQEYLSPSASYCGVDISSTMVNISKQRLDDYTNRASIVCSDGVIKFDLPDASLDRVVSTYVLDLLSEFEISEAIVEFRRLLKSQGRLCLVSLTNGTTLPSRLVAGIWSTVFKVRASVVGGCRPLQLETYLDNRYWSIDYQNVVVQFGVPSEIIVASPK